MAEQGVMPADAALKLTGIRVDHQLVGVEAMTMSWVVGSMDPIPVELTGSNALDVSVPDLIRALGQGDAVGFPAAERIEEQSSTFVACAENSAKLTPFPSQLEPSGNGDPSVILYMLSVVPGRGCGLMRAAWENLAAWENMDLGSG